MARKITWLIVGVLAILGLLFGAYFLLLEIGGDSTKQFITDSWEITRVYLVNNGPLLFLAIAVLPGLILPVAPLLGLAGLWGGENGPWLSCLFCVLSISVNLTWTYWLARGPARGFLIKLLSRTRFRLPDSAPDNILEWALILRLTPGVPFIFSNYGLGLLGMAYIPYMMVSFPILAFTACGYVLAFAGIFGGEWKYLWAGCSIIIISILLGRFALKRKNKYAN